MAATTTAHGTAIRPHGDHVEVDGVRTYYEARGSGAPVLLLHGGLCTAETFDAQTDALAKRFRVYLPERLGHGRTPDVDGPLSYEAQARHVVGFMDAVGIEAAHVAGWSDGALVGLLVALRRPLLVRKLALIDQFVTLHGARDGYLTMLRAFTAADAPSSLVELYGELSPDGADHFRLVFDKLHAVWTADTGIAVSDLAHVAVPTLILAADDGLSTLDHVAAVLEALPDAQLAVVPGTSHCVPLEKPALVNQLLLDFFADEQVPKMFDLSDRTTTTHTTKGTPR
jgi:pimeloyl-ACP methyl ester carboxylesterase